MMRDVVHRNPVVLKLLGQSDALVGALAAVAEWTTMEYLGAWGVAEPEECASLIAPRPLLLMHGMDDLTVNYDSSTAIFEQAGEPKDLWLVPGAGHCQALDADRAEFARRVGALVRAVKGAPSSSSSSK
jgi:alpha-beta hydrolase superfamily lysophospholipase